MESSKQQRGKNVHLSRADQHRYLKRIREEAESGDVLAMGLMVISSKLEQVIQEQGSRSGWRGDDGDPYQEIIKAIRTNDPDSGQLPENK